MYYSSGYNFHTFLSSTISPRLHHRARKFILGKSPLVFLHSHSWEYTYPCSISRGSFLSILVFYPISYNMFVGEYIVIAKKKNWWWMRSDLRHQVIVVCGIWWTMMHFDHVYTSTGKYESVYKPDKLT